LLTPEGILLIIDKWITFIISDLYFVAFKFSLKVYGKLFCITIMYIKGGYFLTG